jgi:hypothetical protein
MAHKKTYKKIVITIGGLAVLGGIIFVQKKNTKTVFEKPVEKKVESIEKGREPWITVFVHGSFGSLLSLLSAYEVLSDKVNGSAYKKVAGRMRKDPFFYREQPLLEKGLKRIVPTYDLSVTGNKLFAAYPLIKAYEDVNERAKPEAEKNYFYTFGWSGLLSQQRRSLEAIRFYNALSVEIEKYNSQGIYPRVRILTHSHGGNLVAYIADIDRELSMGRTDVDGAVARWFKTLPKKAEAKKLKGQKKWGYRPTKKGFDIDELISWGMPVQPETDRLFASKVFKNVFHFYSEEDLVQRIDWVSTKQRYSDRRFNFCRIYDDPKRRSNRLVQSRVMVCQEIKKRKKKMVKKKPDSFWSILFSGGAIVTPTNQDPTHKELWFFSWPNKKDIREFVLSPFPVAVFSPMLVELIKKHPGLDDVDINIRKKEKEINFDLIKHDEPSIQDICSLGENFFSYLKKKVEVWRPKTVSSQDLFNMMRRYADSL